MQVHTTNVHVHTIDYKVQTEYMQVHTKIYCLSSRWAAAELKKVIAMLQNPEFCSKDIGPDLHQRMPKAVDDGCISA